MAFAKRRQAWRDGARPSRMRLTWRRIERVAAKRPALTASKRPGFRHAVDRWLNRSAAFHRDRDRLGGPGNASRGYTIRVDCTLQSLDTTVTVTSGTCYCHPVLSDGIFNGAIENATRGAIYDEFTATVIHITRGWTIDIAKTRRATRSSRRHHFSLIYLQHLWTSLLIPRRRLIFSHNTCHVSSCQRLSPPPAAAPRVGS